MPAQISCVSSDECVLGGKALGHKQTQAKTPDQERVCRLTLGNNCWHVVHVDLMLPCKFLATPLCDGDSGAGLYSVWVQVVI